MAILIHRIEGKIAEEWRESGFLLQLAQGRLEQEIRESERIEGEMFGFPRLRRSSPSTVRREHWRRHSQRSSTRL
jgi:hypothetical protein